MELFDYCFRSLPCAPGTWKTPSFEPASFDTGKTNFLTLWHRWRWRSRRFRSPMERDDGFTLLEIDEFFLNGGVVIKFSVPIRQNAKRGGRDEEFRDFVDYDWGEGRKPHENGFQENGFVSTDISAVRMVFERRKGIFVFVCNFYLLRFIEFSGKAMKSIGKKVSSSTSLRSIRWKRFCSSSYRSIKLHSKYIQLFIYAQTCTFLLLGVIFSKEFSNLTVFARLRRHLVENIWRNVISLYL